MRQGVIKCLADCCGRGQCVPTNRTISRWLLDLGRASAVGANPVISVRRAVCLVEHADTDPSLTRPYPPRTDPDSSA